MAADSPAADADSPTDAPAVAQSAELRYFLHVARHGDLPRMRSVLRHLSGADLRVAADHVQVPECECEPRIASCSCDPDVPAHWVVSVRCKSPTCGWHAREREEDVPYPRCPKCGVNIERSKKRLQRASCGCPAKFLPCPIHQPQIAVPAEIEARIMALLDDEYKDAPLPDTSDVDQVDTSNRRLRIGVMSQRVEFGLSPIHPTDDKWVLREIVERNKRVLSNAIRTAGATGDSTSKNIEDIR
jgi:hypothetical protein